MIGVGPERLERRVDSTTGRLSTALIGPHPALRDIPPTPGPQLIAVESDGATEAIGAHFHPVDQFQLIVRGCGTVAKHPVRVGSLHYADAYRPYGPITPSAEGLHFLTLRATVDFGAHYMPESRRLHAQHTAARSGEKGRSRNLAVDMLDKLAHESLDDEGWVPVLCHDDGLWAGVARLRPGARTTPRRVGGSGMFVAVIAGTAVVAGHLLELGTATFAAKDELIPEIVADETLGTVICLMQLPLAA